MGTKQSPGKYDAMAKAMADEPIFTMLGRDPEAPALIRQWAVARAEAVANGKRPAADAPMLLEAFALSLDMERWRTENDGKWRTTPPQPSPHVTGAGQPLDLTPFQVTTPGAGE